MNNDTDWYILDILNIPALSGQCSQFLFSVLIICDAANQFLNFCLLLSMSTYQLFNVNNIFDLLHNEMQDIIVENIVFAFYWALHYTVKFLLINNVCTHGKYNKWYSIQGMVLYLFTNIIAL